MKEVFKHDFKTYRKISWRGLCWDCCWFDCNAILGQVFQIFIGKTEWNIWHCFGKRYMPSIHSSTSHIS